MKRFLTTILLLIMLIGNLGLTLSIHFCDGMTVESNIRISAERDSCNMTESKATCDDEAKQAQAFTQVECCIDAYEFLQAFDEGVAKTTINNDTNNTLSFVQYPTADLQEDESNSVTPHSIFHPPAQKQDIAILVQSFLI